MKLKESENLEGRGSFIGSEKIGMGHLRGKGNEIIHVHYAPFGRFPETGVSEG